MPDPFTLVDVTKFTDGELANIEKHALRNKNLRQVAACVKEFRRRDALRRTTTK